MNQELVEIRIADRYRVLRTLGASEMATVVEAEDELLRRRVAVKRLQPLGDEAMGRRVLREARIGATLNHPNLVVVFDTLLHESALMVVMEYLEDGDLAQRLKAGPLERPRALHVLRTVAAALDHAHEHGVVHRAVKPANILLGPGEVVKLADLGLAYSAEQIRIAHPGTPAQTAGAMAPEQLRGERSTSATDVYGLGMVARALLGGGEAGDVLERAMADDPARRPASAGALVGEIEAALEATAGSEAPAVSEGAVAPPSRRTAVTRATAPPEGRRAPGPTTPRARRSALRPAVVLSVIALLLAAGGVITLVAGRSTDDTPDRTASATGDATRAAPRPDGGDRAGSAESVKDPLGTVRAFYGRAARQDAVGVCALRGPRLGARFSCAALTERFQTLRSVSFDELALQSRTSRTARVSFATTASHAERTDRCRGTAALVRGEGDDWLVDGLDVTCPAA